MVEYLQKIFTPETVTVILGLIASAISVIKMAVTLKQQSKINVKNAEEIATSVKESAKESAEQIVVETIKPYLDELKVVKNSLQTFSKVFLLMQENNAQSRLAILDLIEKLGEVDVEEVREVVIQEIAEEEKKEEEKQEKLTQISEGRF